MCEGMLHVVKSFFCTSFLRGDRSERGDSKVKVAAVYNVLGNCLRSCVSDSVRVTRALKWLEEKRCS